MKRLRLERDRLLVALAYFTRVPIPAWVGWSPDHLARASRYFPLVGLGVGIANAAVLWAAAQAFPAVVAVLLSMSFSLMVTGAFHEDGLADTADGLGGAYTPERVLEIMKDSRIGTFGSAALLLSLALKAALLTALTEHATQLAMIALCLAHATSRWLPVELMRWLSYVSDAAQARAKPVAEGITVVDALVARLTALAAGLWVLWTGALPASTLLAGLAGLLMLAVVIRQYLRQRIGGYTGDALGASQQLAELLIYLVWVGSLSP
jgi:adenosylcobinamide-GDP ribazoletransferase